METHAHDPAIDPTIDPALEADARPLTAEPSVGSPSRPRSSFVARLFAIGIPALICLAGIGVAGMLVATRPEAERAAQASQGVPVRTAAVAVAPAEVFVRAQGQVIAAQRVVLQPELNGRVIWMNDALVPGGRVAEGETLVRIDPRDYRAALEAQRAQLESSRVQIQQERSRQAIAEREWALLRDERGAGTDEGRDLALRQPQIRSAEASLRAAESNLRQARTNLSRTSVVAPFDAFVQTENVDLGQLVGPTAQLATLVGTEHFWVQVSVPMEELRWIRVPGVHGAEGSAVTVTQEVADGDAIVRRGRVIRLLGDLDPVGRMARVLVEIDDPLGLSRPEGEAPGLPMLLGAFVHVRIEAGTLDDVVEIPREALHADDRVYLLDGESRLAIREVDVVWRREQSVLVRGLAPGEDLITSQVPTPVEGTVLRRIEPEADAAPATDGDPEDGDSEDGAEAAE